DLRRSQLRVRLRSGLGDREKDGAEVDLRVVRLGRATVRAVLVEHDIGQDEEVAVGVVEDVGDAPLPAGDLPADDVRVRVEGERDLLLFGTKHGPQSSGRFDPAGCACGGRVLSEAPFSAAPFCPAVLAAWACPSFAWRSGALGGEPRPRCGSPCVTDPPPLVEGHRSPPLWTRYHFPCPC